MGIVKFNQGFEPFPCEQSVHVWLWWLGYLAYQAMKDLDILHIPKGTSVLMKLAA